jgi:hypothetical protein
MKNLLLPLYCCLGLLGLQAQSSTSLESIYFATASAELDPAAIATLEEVAERALAYPDYRLQLTAHTDSRGRVNYNQELAEERAAAVSRWLHERGLDTDQLKVRALGETEAGSDRGSAARLQQNRRVDLYLTGWSWSDMTVLRDSLAQSLQQRIDIRADQDASWSGKKGGWFYLPAGSLVDADGRTVTGDVEIKLIEAYTLGDMLKAGLTSLSSEGVLQTGGMLYWEAQQDGRPLDLAPEATLNVRVPTDNFQDDMTLFYGAGHSDTPPATWEDSSVPVVNSFPRLQLAKAPKRPARTHYVQKFLHVERPPVSEDPRYPSAPTMVRPRQPHEPVYERITYRPSGLEKLTMSKAKREAVTAALREEKRQAYEARLAKYQAQKPQYDSLQQDYQERCRAFEVQWVSEVDAEGNLLPVHPQFSSLQAAADSVFAVRITKYQQDSIAYESYRTRKLAAYEQRVAAFEQQNGTDEASLQTYVLAINRMGWANIDRFMKLNPVTPILAYEVGATTGSKALVFLLFPERNIILRMPSSGATQYTLGRVPIGEKAKIIAVRIVDQRAYLAQQELIVESNSSIALTFAPSRLKDIRSAMEDI